MACTYLSPPNPRLTFGISLKLIRHNMATIDVHAVAIQKKKRLSTNQCFVVIRRQ